MAPPVDFLRKLAGFATLLALIAAFDVAHANDTFKIVYNFAGGADGARPYAGLIADNDGNFYGTTYSGGSTGCGGQGCGTVFKLTPEGTHTVLYAFTGTNGDGGWPTAGLVMDDGGNLYGTTNNYGIRGCHSYGCGTVFRVDRSGKETVLYAFHESDGGNPYAGLLLDKKGNLYGTTVGGGRGAGVIFKLAPSGKETVLHSFCCSDGSYPYGGLIADKTGNLYGTASEGGSCQWTDFNGCGTVFKLSPRGSLKVLHTFSGYPDGAVPVAGLTFDKEGNLYGTTVYGGHSSCWDVGCGTVFKIKPNGSYTVFHSFCEQGVTICAFQPRGEIIFDARGNIYGTTYIGGNDDCDQKQGCGLAFKISPESAEHVLHIFQEGFYPLGSLIKDSNGNLYGTTQYGGGANGGIIFTVRR